MGIFCSGRRMGVVDAWRTFVKGLVCLGDKRLGEDFVC